MTEEQIEIRVEKMTDRLDAAFMSGGSMTQAEYDERIREIDAWAENEYLFVTRSAPV